MTRAFRWLLPAFLLCLLPAAAQAQWIMQGDFYFNIDIFNPGIVETRYYFGTNQDVVVPASIDIGGGSNVPVNVIGTGTFSGNSVMTNVTIPDTVTVIQSNSFGHCSALRNVKIPDSVTYIGFAAFYQASGLVTVDIGNGVTNLETMAFYDCPNLASVRLGTNLLTTGPWAFYNCQSLTNVTMSDSVILFGIATFARCLNLPQIALSRNLSNISGGVFSECTSLVNVTIPKAVTVIWDNAFGGCTNLQGVYFLGNQPQIWSEFPPQTIGYYMPGTLYWTPYFYNTPLILWNPKAQTHDGSFGVGPNGFGFNITGSSNLNIVVEACSDPAHPAWLPVGTNILTGGSSYFSDSQWTNHPARFYRLRSP